MGSNWWFNTLLIIFLVALSILYLIPTFTQKADGETSLPSWYPFSKTIRPGLDLKGGMHLVLGVEWEKALIDDATLKASNLKDWCQNNSIPIVDATTDGETNQISVKFKSVEEMNKYAPKIIDNWKSLSQLVGVSSSPEVLTLTQSEQEVKQIKDNSIKQAQETIHRRIDPTGTGEMSLARQGASSLVIELPGFSNIDRAKNLISQTALLEFQFVDESDAAQSLFASVKDSLPPGAKRLSDRTQDYVTGPDLKALMDLVKKINVPAGLEVLFEKEPDKTVPGKFTYRSYTLKKKVELTGDKIEDARVVSDNNNKPVVSIEFNPDGARIFARITADNVGKRMAIILDKEVRSAPVIKEKIPHGRAQITLGEAKNLQKMYEDAKDLSIVLRAGALPAPVKFEEIRQIGASLGADSIEQGKNAIIASSIAVIAFMIFYYKLAGVFASIAVVLNVLFILACMAAFQATLTLPGLAGIALTIGMAVDANVIINERVREELRMGKTPRSAVETGYARAFWTIFDSNITTAISGFVLWSYGSGPIQGFAITMLIGLASSMYTAIVVARLLQDWILIKFKPQSLSI